MTRREVFHLPTEVSTRTNVSHTMVNDPYFSGITPSSVRRKNQGNFWGVFCCFFKHKHHLLCFPQRAWWWPRSTLRPVACWPVRSPRRWFRGASWEERPSPRSCFMNPKVFFHVSWLDELTCLGIWECQHRSRILFFSACECNFSLTKNRVLWVESWPLCPVCYKLWPLHFPFHQPPSGFLPPWSPIA